MKTKGARAGPAPDLPPLPHEARRIVVGGRVQGVGMRPYVYGHARKHELQGWVRNTSGQVEIHVQGRSASLDGFLATLVAQAPPTARPEVLSVESIAAFDAADFTIAASSADADVDIHVPADLFTCDDCLREMNDAADRRYRYPFINCTQCGPRYSLIEALPYDRASTSMAGFTLCSDCAREYTDPADRRHHAEPTACARCGPSLSFTEAGHETRTGEDALQTCIRAIASGKIVAIKGVGGYHLVCDAHSNDAVNRLRQRKHRQHKPLAVMFPAPLKDPLSVLNQHLDAGENEARLLQSPQRPIVLLPALAGNPLAANIAPGLDEIGAMLPYSPLHHQLLAEHGAAVVATSANISGEPVLTDNDEVEHRLGRVADAFLHHDRPIVRPADDSVFRPAAGRILPMRLGRGFAPLELELPFRLDKPVLAVGAHMKNTLAMGWDNRMVIAPHIGDMDSPRSLQVFEQCVADLQQLYQVRIEHILCDRHPGYATHRWAHGQGLPVSEIYHHHAHAAAAWLEAQHGDGNMLVFTWDGVGLGADGTLWGGEALLGAPGNWRQIGSFRPFRLPGGERAGREPWRSAAALCWEADMTCPVEDAGNPVLHSFWKQGKNAPVTSAVGRLFDAAAALVGLCTHASHEGQGPMQLEALARTPGMIDEVQSVELPMRIEQDRAVSDWEPLLPMLLDNTHSPAARAACFHQSMAQALLAQARHARSLADIDSVGLTGGVFQNRILLEASVSLLEANGFTVVVPALLPPNDAAISAGQVVEFGSP